MDDENGLQDVGSVTVFEYNKNTSHINTDTARKITPDDGRQNLQFGSHVAVNADFVLVSADENGDGSVYVYDAKANFQFVQKV